MWLQDTTYEGGTLFYNVLNQHGEKYIAYHNETEFLVQVGRGKKSSYKTSYRIIGNLRRAIMYFDGINLGPGYKKRLLMPACSKNPVLARQSFSGLP